MDANEPGLFDLPNRERPGTANRPLRGRNQQTRRPARLPPRSLSSTLGHCMKPVRKPQGTR